MAHGGGGGCMTNLERGGEGKLVMWRMAGVEAV